MVFRGQIFDTLREWNEAEIAAHQSCMVYEGYSSKRYSYAPIITIDGKFILTELKGFEDNLIDAGLEFVDLDKSIIITI